MNKSIIALVATLLLTPSGLLAIDLDPDERLALDVVEWAKHGSDKFDTKYADRKLFMKKKKFRLAGTVFRKLFEKKKIPEAHLLGTPENLKKIDWETTGSIWISKVNPDGSFLVQVSLSPLGMCAYRIYPIGESYRVVIAGGS